MFKKTKVKIIAAIMTVLLTILAGTLTVIYAASYTEVYQKNQDMLDRYIRAYLVNGNPKSTPSAAPPESDGRPEDSGLSLEPKGFEAEEAFQLATFYSVAFSGDGEAFSIDNSANPSLAGDELTAIALRLMRSGRQRGTSGNFVYRVKAAETYTLVALMDNTILSDSITTLFRNTLLFGSAMLFLFLLLSIFLAGRIVAPLEQSYQRQKRFISDAGHELKTPIAVIRANAEMLGRELGESKWLSNINFENDRMAELVRQLLELAKTEAVKPDLSEVDFSRIVTGGALPFEGIAFEHGVSLSCDIEEGLRVYGNSGQLGQLVSILMDNAILHAYAGTVVTVSLKRERRTALLAVSNEGDEIPAEQQEQIFERFYRTDQARSGERYGLGLAIAKAVVLGHKGKIFVSSKAGITKFSAFIPLVRT